MAVLPVPCWEHSPVGTVCTVFTVRHRTFAVTLATLLLLGTTDPSQSLPAHAGGNRFPCGQHSSCCPSQLPPCHDESTSCQEGPDERHHPSVLLYHSSSHPRNITSLLLQAYLQPNLGVIIAAKVQDDVCCCERISRGHGSSLLLPVVAHLEEAALPGKHLESRRCAAGPSTAPRVTVSRLLRKEKYTLYTKTRAREKQSSDQKHIQPSIR